MAGGLEMRNSIAVLLMTVWGSANAATIGQFSVISLGSGTHGVGQVTIDLTMFPFDYPTDPVEHILTVPISTADIGSTVLIDDKSTLDALGAYFTNGINDTIQLSVQVGGSGGGEFESESSAFGTAPDFAGYTITGIGFAINSLTIDSPGSDPNNDGVWTDYTYDIDFEVYGSIVPVPAAVVLFPSALTLLVFMRRRRRQ